MVFAFDECVKAIVCEISNFDSEESDSLSLMRMER